MGTSRVAADALRHARQDPRVAAALGTPVRARWLVPGYISTDETGWSESRAWIPVYGGKSDGTIYARGEADKAKVASFGDVTKPDGPASVRLPAWIVALGPRSKWS